MVYFDLSSFSILDWLFVFCCTAFLSSVFKWHVLSRLYIAFCHKRCLRYVAACRLVTSLLDGRTCCILLWRIWTSGPRNRRMKWQVSLACLTACFSWSALTLSVEGMTNHRCWRHHASIFTAGGYLNGIRRYLLFGLLGDLMCFVVNIHEVKFSVVAVTGMLSRPTSGFMDLSTAGECI